MVLRFEGVRLVGGGLLGFGESQVIGHAMWGMLGHGSARGLGCGGVGVGACWGAGMPVSSP